MKETTSYLFRQEAAYARVELNALVEGGLRLAIPKRGELTLGSIDYLSSLGWDTRLLKPETDKLAVDITSDLKVFKLRADDAVNALRAQAIDMAILGADVIAEEKLDPDDPADFIQLNPLGFGNCSFRMAFPLDQPIPSEQDVFKKLKDGGKIATSLPNLLTAVFKQRGFELQRDQVITLTGSVEAAIEVYADVFAVADRVSSGDTMFANYLRPAWALWESPGAYLVANRDFFQNRIYREPESAYFSFS
jgi:ATP phosphoribosyltransferase